MELDKIDQFRKKAYILFSNLLSKPNQEIESELKAGNHLKFWQEAPLGVDNIEISSSWQEENIIKLNEWKKLWRDEISIAKGRLQLVESVYKQWTIDESCQMPFAKKKGLVMGDWAHHMLHLYQKLEFKLPEQFSYCPDHLLLELEFMSLLIEEVDYQRQYQFIKQHLDWLDSLVSEAEDKKISKIYVDLFKWIRDYVARDKDFLAK